MGFFDDLANGLFGTGPTPTQTSQSSTVAPLWYQNMIRNLAVGAGEVAGQSYQANPNQRIAPFTTDQQAAFDRTRQGIGTFLPYFDAAAGDVNAGRSAISAGANTLGTAGGYLGEGAGAYGTAGDTLSRALGTAGTAQGYFGQAGDIYGQSLGAIQGAGGDLDAARQGISTAQSYLSNAGGPFNADELAQYFNPYTQQVVANIGDLAGRNLSENLLPQVNTTFTGAGQFGSSRHADFTARAVRDANESALREQAKALETGYQSSMDAYLKGRGLGVQAGTGLTDAAKTSLGAAEGQAGIGTKTAGVGAQVANLGAATGDLARTEAGIGGQQAGIGQGFGQLAGTAGGVGAQLGGLAGQSGNLATIGANLGTTAQGANLRDAAALETIGQSQQALDQRNLDLLTQDFLAQRGYPQQQIQFLSNILRGASPGSTTTTTGPAPATASPISQLGGLAIGGIGLYNALTRARGGAVRRYGHGGQAVRPTPFRRYQVGGAVTPRYSELLAAQAVPAGQAGGIDSRERMTGMPVATGGTPAPVAAAPKRVTFDDLMARAQSGVGGPKFTNRELNALTPGQRQALMRATNEAGIARGATTATPGPSEFSPSDIQNKLDAWSARGAPAAEIPAMQKMFADAYAAGNVDPAYLEANYRIMEAGGYIPDAMKRQNQTAEYTARSPFFINKETNPTGVIPQYNTPLSLPGVRSPTMQTMSDMIATTQTGRFIDIPGQGPMLFPSQKALQEAGYDPAMWGSSASTIGQSAVTGPPGQLSTAQIAQSLGMGPDISWSSFLSNPSAFISLLNQTGYSPPAENQQYSYLDMQGAPQLIRIDPRTGEVVIDPTKLYETADAFSSGGVDLNNATGYSGYNPMIGSGGMPGYEGKAAPSVIPKDTVALARKLRDAGLEGPSTLGYLDSSRVLSPEFWSSYDQVRSADADLRKRTEDYYQGRMSPQDMIAFAQEIGGYRAGADPYAQQAASVPLSAGISGNTIKATNSGGLPAYTTPASRITDALKSGLTPAQARNAGTFGSVESPVKQHPWLQPFMRSSYGSQYNIGDFERWQNPKRQAGIGETIVNHPVLGRVSSNMAHSFDQWLKAGGGPMAKLGKASWQDATALGYPALGESVKVGTRGNENVVRYREEFGPYPKARGGAVRAGIGGLR